MEAVFFSVSVFMISFSEVLFFVYMIVSLAGLHTPSGQNPILFFFNSEHPAQGKGSVSIWWSVNGWVPKDGRMGEPR
jgi:hypothetical protein